MVHVFQRILCMFWRNKNWTVSDLKWTSVACYNHIIALIKLSCCGLNCEWIIIHCDWIQIILSFIGFLWWTLHVTEQYLNNLFWYFISFECLSKNFVETIFFCLNSFLKFSHNFCFEIFLKTTLSLIHNAPLHISLIKLPANKLEERCWWGRRRVHNTWNIQCKALPFDDVSIHQAMVSNWCSFCKILLENSIRSKKCNQYYATMSCWVYPLESLFEYCCDCSLELTKHSICCAVACNEWAFDTN